MSPELFFFGLMIGFAVAMPVGPVGLLCIRHSLANGLAHGFVAGIGAATGDALYGAIGGLGMSVAAPLLKDYLKELQFLGGGFLILFGAHFFKTPHTNHTEERTGTSYKRAFWSTFLLTIANPLTILAFAGAYAALDISESTDHLTDPLFMTSGIWIGSAVWWLFLISMATLFKGFMTPKATHWFNRISGSMIMTFGAIGVITSLRTIFHTFSDI